MEMHHCRIVVIRRKTKMSIRNILLVLSDDHSLSTILDVDERKERM